MSSDDDLLAKYLNTVAEYKGLAEDTCKHWRSGFIELAAAKRANLYGTHNFDTRSTARLEVEQDSRLSRVGTLADNLKMFGAFVPEALKSAQNAFVLALEGEVKLLQLKRDIDLTLSKLDTSSCTTCGLPS